MVRGNKMGSVEWEGPVHGKGAAILGDTHDSTGAVLLLVKVGTLLMATGGGIEGLEDPRNNNKTQERK